MTRLTFIAVQSIRDSALQIKLFYSNSHIKSILLTVDLLILIAGYMFFIVILPRNNNI